MRWSIRSQLLVPPLTMLFGVAGISTWTAIASANQARRQIEKQVHDVARTLSESSFPLNRATLRQMRGLSGAEYVLIPGAGTRTDSFEGDGVAFEPPPDAVGAGLGPRVRVAGQNYLCSGLQLWRGEKSYTLYILYPEARWRDALWEAVRPSLMLGGFVGLASVALAVGVGQRLSRRVRELERRTRLIAAGDFSPMPLPGRDDELRDLSRSVNEMAQQLARLQEAVQRAERLRLLGQVSGGLAHQLRNSVTGARLAVQLHARESAPAGAEALDVALRQLTLMESHLKRFLDLGRAGSLRLEPCPLAELLGNVVALLRPRCRHAHIDLRWQPPNADCVVRADADQLGQLFLNVLGNAIEAAGPGGWVQVELQIADCRLQIENGQSAICNLQSAIVEVTDSGPGPPPEVAARLFEPFVTGKPEGVGLGLAVAWQVVEAHGGHIGWRRESDRTCFRIELPLEQRP
jgi:signal transduction histidine kinase